MHTSHKVAAVFLFNHRYEKNIERLEQIYRDRFSSRKYIMPFSSIDDDKVIRVYETSVNFSGHIAQAGSRLLEADVTHYAFIADDLILNPALNECNLAEELGLSSGCGYIKSLVPADNLRCRWTWSGETAMSLRKYGRGFNYVDELPAADAARARFESMGLIFNTPRPKSLADLKYALWTIPRISLWCFFMGLGVTGRAAEYPLLSGYSDFIVVPAECMLKFIHYCGVFAAMNIFAEVAVPTALALACDHVETELRLNEHFMDVNAEKAVGARRSGVEFWRPAQASAFAKQAEFNTERLLNNIDEGTLYVHPVKLSAFER